MRYAVIAGMITLLSLAVSVGPVLAETQRVRLDVNGLSCVTDMLAVRAMLEGIQGVGDFRIDTDSSSVDLTFDDASTTVHTITKTLDEGAYHVEKVLPIDSQ